MKPGRKSKNIVDRRHLSSSTPYDITGGGSSGSSDSSSSPMDKGTRIRDAFKKAYDKTEAGDRALTEAVRKKKKK